jgi:L-fuculose-phosphate aldolase
VATEIESLCQQYLLARQTGQPVLLSSEEMLAVIDRFRSYGRNANQTHQ